MEKDAKRISLSHLAVDKEQKGDRMQEKRRLAKRIRRTKNRMPAYRWLLPVLLLVFLPSSVAVAYLSANVSGVFNYFKAAEANLPEIMEEFDGNEKKNVYVSVNSENYAVYVRAAIVVTWKKTAGGEVLGRSPQEGTDYTITMNETDWFEQEGFWYCKKAVTDQTPNLIISCQPVSAAPEDGYALNVEIIAQTVQAIGRTEGNEPIVQTVWPVSGGDGADLSKS